MSANDTELNQDLPLAKSPSSPAHQHLEDDALKTITNKTEQEKLDELGMDSARRAGNRFAKNDERIPTDSIFSK